MRQMLFLIAPQIPPTMFTMFSSTSRVKVIGNKSVCTIRKIITAGNISVFITASVFLLRMLTYFKISLFLSKNASSLSLSAFQSSTSFRLAWICLSSSTNSFSACALILFTSSMIFAVSASILFFSASVRISSPFS